MTETALVLFSGSQDSATCQACDLRAKGWHAYAGDVA